MLTRFPKLDQTVLKKHVFHQSGLVRTNLLLS